MRDALTHSKSGFFNKGTLKMVDKKKKGVTLDSLAIAMSVITDPSQYNLLYSTKNASKKEYRQKLDALYQDSLKLIDGLPLVDTSEAKTTLTGLLKVMDSKTLTETRVRWWIILMLPIMTDLATQIKDNNEKLCK
jgi:hypothetical protein